MNSLEKARETINRVDSEMAALFTERMRAAELVAAEFADDGISVVLLTHICAAFGVG